MSLTLQVVRYRGTAPAQALSISVNQQPVIIGRRPGCDLILPDPDRIISGEHARLSWNGDAYYLADISTNGTYVNHADMPVGRDKPVPVNDGDEINIGDYDIQVSIRSDAAPAVATIPPAPQDPFGNMQPAEPEPPPAAPAAEPEMDPFVAQPPPALDDPGWSGDEPVDPLRLIDGPGDGFSLPGDTLPIAEDIGIPGDDRQQDWPGQQGSVPDHIPADQAYFSPPQVIPDDWDLPDDSPTGPDAPPQPDAPAPTPAPPPPAAQPPVPSPAPTAAEADAARALLAGLGLDKVRLGDQETQELMHLVGELLREMTAGVMRILINRASLKNQMRMDMTTIKAAENNPLKFSTGAEDALNRLLINPGQGYLPPREAVHEAIGDLQVHEMALMAGLRAALEAQFARFAPERLEKGLKQTSALGSMRSASRKAKCWDLFTDAYKHMRAQAEDDPLRLSGEAFIEAYEAQVRQLKAARKNDEA